MSAIAEPLAYAHIDDNLARRNAMDSMFLEKAA